jgi:hypothetical protein
MSLIKEGEELALRRACGRYFEVHEAAKDFLDMLDSDCEDGIELPGSFETRRTAAHKEILDLIGVERTDLSPLMSDLDQFEDWIDFFVRILLFWEWLRLSKEEPSSWSSPTHGHSLKWYEEAGMTMRDYAFTLRTDDLTYSEVEKMKKGRK